LAAALVGVQPKAEVAVLVGTYLSAMPTFQLAH
jgi:hypothetical protein